LPSFPLPQVLPDEPEPVPTQSKALKAEKAIGEEDDSDDDDEPEEEEEDDVQVRLTPTALSGSPGPAKRSCNSRSPS
jgi:hypothetical protein